MSHCKETLIPLDQNMNEDGTKDAYGILYKKIGGSFELSHNY